MSSPIPTARDLEIKSDRRRRWLVGGAILALAIMAGTLSLIAFAYIEQSDKVEALETQNQEILGDHHAIGKAFAEQTKKLASQTRQPRGRRSFVLWAGLCSGSGGIPAASSDPAAGSPRRGGARGSARASGGSRLGSAHQGRRGRLRGALARARALREPNRSAQRVDETGARWARAIADARPAPRPAHGRVRVA